MYADSAATPWPDGRRGAVSLTFDDGMQSQLHLAIPLLGEYGLAATFYLNPPRDGDESAWCERLAPWCAAAEQGHEIGNHSLTHPCSQNFDFIDRGLESMTLADIERDVLEAERRLRAGIPGQTVRSFCYPCYQNYVGMGEQRQSYVPVIARHFVAARGRGERANDPARCDLHDLWSWPAERMSGAELVGLAEGAATEGRWAVLTFHGVNEGHLPIGEVDLRALCAFLARQRERIWTAPVATIAQHVAAWRASAGAGTGRPA
ncbi:MAG TPA: polysaccharide deacetylase family protein [Chloroflexota bacterium]|nr:polysaccharide deacetylase family protein [Chloroflexota bacterium]